MELCEFAKQLGIENLNEFTPDTLIPEQRIRDFCCEDKCGNYGNNYMCPPYIGSLNEIKVKLGRFKHGFLFQYSQNIEVQNDRQGVIQTKKDFHGKILQMEEFLREKGIDRVWGMIGGSCNLCDVCKVKSHEPCLHPEKARTSLEAIGIDVLALLDKFGLDNKFYTDKIIWTGCVIF